MSRAEAEEHLKAKAPSWSFTKVDGGVDAMGREYKFRRYKDAASFVNEVVDIVHDLQHHPIITLTFHEVTVVTYTHEVYAPGETGEKIKGPGFSARDLALAEGADSVYIKLLDALVPGPSPVG